mgnify:CR=1 FL=1|tara:strand:+ start:2920 stop:4359 length:1440 start_codon:yes stop_codon:yes gene_type:complete
MGMFDKIKKFRPMDYFESAQGLDGMPTGDQLMKDYDDQGIDFSEGSQIYDRGSQMMERGSAYNQQARASMQNNASDSQAESFRQSQRLAAMGGGMPTGVMTAQNMQGANNMQANASAQFENQFAQNQNQGIGILSGAMNNQAQLMQQAQGADQARRMAKNNASQQFMGVLGSGLKMAAASQGATTGQRGGSVSAAPKGSHYMPNGKLMKNSEMEGYKQGGMVRGYNTGGYAQQLTNDNETGSGGLLPPHLAYNTNTKKTVKRTPEEEAKYQKLLEKNNQLNRVSSREDEEMEAGIRQPEYEASAPNSVFPEMQEVDTPDMPTGRGYGTLASSKAKGALSTALNATAYGAGAGARGIEAGAGAIYGGTGTLLGAAKKGVGKFFEKKEGGSMFGKAMMGAGHLATEYANPGSMMEHMRIKQLNAEEEGTDEPKVADLGLSKPKLGKQQGGYMQMQHGGNVQSQRMGLLSQIPMRVGGGKIG